MSREHAFVWPTGFCGVCGCSAADVMNNGGPCIEADNVVALAPVLATRKMSGIMQAAAIMERLAAMIPALEEDTGPPDGPMAA